MIRSVQIFEITEAPGKLKFRGELGFTVRKELLKVPIEPWIWRI